MSVMHGNGSHRIIDLNMLLRAYAMGMFPMADAREDNDVFWVEPEQRAILPLDGFRLSKSLAKTLRSDRFAITMNADFPAVVRQCAQSTLGRELTWINHIIEHSYIALHEHGHAHSVETWIRGELVGGLYGVALGRVFCGESMFTRADNASKVALAALVAAMRRAGFMLLDCQFMTDHLASMGAIEISQRDYLDRLDRALQGSAFAEELSGRPRPGYSPSAGGAAGGVPSLAAGFASLAGAGAVAGVDGGGVDAPCFTGASSPGKRIAQSLTQTS